MEEFKTFRPESKRSVSNINCLENDKFTNFVVKDIAKVFSAYVSNLTANFMSKLPNPSNKYGVLSVA